MKYKAVLSVILIASAILSVGVSFVMRVPTAPVGGFSPQLLASGLSLSILILLMVRAKSIWETERIRKLRDFGPDLFGYAITALVVAFLLFLSDLANLQDYLITSPIKGFVILIQMSLVSALASTGTGLLALMYLSDWLTERGLVKRNEFTENYDLTSIIINYLKEMNKEILIPWDETDREKQPRIVGSKWQSESGEFELLIEWKENIRKKTEKKTIGEEAKPPITEVIEEDIPAVQRCQIKADAKGRIISVSMLKPETI